MLTKILGVLWVMAMLGAGAMVVHEIRNPTLSPDAHARAHTLLIVNEDGHGGSGVAWDETTVLTAAHVMKGDLSDYTVKQGDKAWGITEAQFIPDRDAILLTVGPLITPYGSGMIVEWDGDLPVLDRADMRLGQTVLLAGHPWCGPVQVSHGVVTGQWGGSEDWLWVLDADSNPGNSGGPVFDEDGNLIAIVTAGTLGWGASLAVVLPISEVLSGLERTREEGTGGSVGRGRGSRNGLYRPRHPALSR